jgi:hypothetical protein
MGEMGAKKLMSFEEFELLDAGADDVEVHKAEPSSEIAATSATTP